ncbi:DUF5082 domain-containing protein [Psychrobacillus sp. AK 1817]|uniref:DUF5082 family protein n=2 Tax=Bacillaceae TaxID=186817 RepID=A0ABR8R5U7_9BACI|nr:DUF5082 family protein [Psychrobacillus faecigallinarum]QEY22934.1 DUF5082 domain-containing protein [Psychrobacillus sp. AK 1817]QGM32621.1 DUF5082 domain-containing protein [Bacillus sp. N3536]
MIAKKEEEIRRLNECQSSLTGKQSEFTSNEPKCMEPELTTTTWYGTLATAFDEIRESGIKAPYQEIIGTQFSAVFSAISAKIAEIQAEIAALRATIARIAAEEAANPGRYTGV